MKILLIQKEKLLFLTVLIALGFWQVQLTRSQPARLSTFLNRHDREASLYWSAPSQIGRTNLDNGNSETLLFGAGFPGHIALDETTGDLYWTDSLNGQIIRAEQNGEFARLITSEIVSPRGIALDIEAGKMYWVDDQVSKIQRANLDGSDIEDLLVENLQNSAGRPRQLNCQGVCAGRSVSF